VVRRDCSAPRCGGYFVRSVNSSSTPCPSAERPLPECHVTALDLEALHVADSDRAELLGRTALLLLRGALSAVAIPGSLDFGRLCMRSPQRLAVSVLVAVFALVSSAGAHEGTNGSKFPGVPLPARIPGSSPYSPSSGVQVLAHVDPGGGFNSDVVAYNGFAYLGSWGVPSFGAEYCPAQGVRVFDLADPRHPQLVSTFGSGALEPDLAGTWTEKVMVRRVRTPSFRGDLAVASLQSCYGGDPDAFQPVTGLGVWDVTNPARPRRLGLYRTGTAGVHEFWVQPRGAHVYAYVAIPLSEIPTGPGFFPPFQLPSSPGAGDLRIVDLTGNDRCDRPGGNENGRDGAAIPMPTLGHWGSLGAGVALLFVGLCLSRRERALLLAIEATEPPLTRAAQRPKRD
jgi:hypothetical protein